MSQQWQVICKVDDIPVLDLVESVVVEPVQDFEAVAEPAPSAEFSKPSLVIDKDRSVSAGQKPNVLTFAPKPKPPAAPLPKIPGAEFGGTRQGSSGPAQVQHLAARRAGPQEVVKVSAELLEELNTLDAKAQNITVPLSYADEVYALRSHIQMVRARLT